MRRQQLEEATPNERMYRLRFEKMIENSLDVLRYCCLGFCGPTVLIESFLTVIYYKEVTLGCIKHVNDGFTHVLVYVLMIGGCISLSVTAYCCYATFILGKTIK